MRTPAPSFVSYNGSFRGILRQVTEYGLSTYDLVAPPRRLLGSESTTPLIETSVDVRRVDEVPTPLLWCKVDRKTRVGWD